MRSQVKSEITNFRHKSTMHERLFSTNNNEKPWLHINSCTDGLPSKKQPDAIANDTVELGIEMWHFIIVSTKHYRKKPQQSIIDWKIYAKKRSFIIQNIAIPPKQDS